MLWESSENQFGPPKNKKDRQIFEKRKTFENRPPPENPKSHLVQIMKKLFVDKKKIKFNAFLVLWESSENQFGPPKNKKDRQIFEKRKTFENRPPPENPKSHLVQIMKKLFVDKKKIKFNAYFEIFPTLTSFCPA